jgi:catechol 2,3-dioxygenase-like lactoylglutathione lyase family enzyme
MSFRSALTRNAGALQPDYVRRELAARDAVFRFSVPVLRVRDVGATVAWYRRHLGFSAEPFPERAPHQFAIIERDGVQLLVRRAEGSERPRVDHHTGWDLYLWADGVDFARLEASLSDSEIVRPRTPMGSSVVEVEVRDPDGYVLCIGGPAASTAPPSSLTPPPTPRASAKWS